MTEWARKMTRDELAKLVEDCRNACGEKHFAAYGAITHVKQAIYELDRSKSNPEDNSQLLWNEQFDKIRQCLVYALDALKEATE